MYFPTHILNNAVKNSCINYIKCLSHLNYLNLIGNTRFHGTLHWKGVYNPNDLRILSQKVINEAKKTLDKVFSTKNPVTQELLSGIDHVSNMLCLLADPAELLKSAHPEEEWRIAAEDVVDQVTTFIEKVNMDKHSYNILNNAISQSKDLTFEEQKVLSHMISSMRDHGVHLSDTQKNEYLTLSQEEREHSKILTDPNYKYIKLPKSLIPFSINNNNSNELFIDNYLSNYLLKSTHNSDTRRQIYSYITKRSEPLEKSLLGLTRVRHKMAKMRQFNSYSSLSLRDNILSTPEQVDRYLSNFLQSIEKRIIKELEVISRDTNEVNAWDLDYLIAHHRHNDNPNTFTLRSLIDLFAKILKSLFGIDLVHCSDGDPWKGIIKYYFVKNNIKLCTLYLDPFNRENKSSLFAQFTLKCSKSFADTERNAFINDCFDLCDGQQLDYQTPSTAVICNFDGDSMDIKIDTTYAIILFHELGHTLHTLLSSTKYQHLSGNRGGVDFAEFSSHLFELYPRTIFSVPPFDVLEAGRMAVLALIDQIVHSTEWLDYNELESAIRSKLLNHPALSQTFKGNTVLDILGIPNICKFDHLVHYGGSYYCYLYSRSLVGMVYELAAKGNEYSEKFGSKLYTFLRQGSVNSGIEPILDICGGDRKLIESPEQIDPNYTFVY